MQPATNLFPDSNLGVVRSRRSDWDGIHNLLKRSPIRQGEP